MRRRVVITGMGVITPLGDTVEGLFRAQIEGQSGVGPITRFDARTFPTTFAAEVRGFDLARYVRQAERWAEAGAASQFARMPGCSMAVAWIARVSASTWAPERAPRTSRPPWA
jgi:3-oxoacyl-[acyl-carrier-protein] synthase II